MTEIVQNGFKVDASTGALIVSSGAPAGVVGTFQANTNYTQGQLILQGGVPYFATSTFTSGPAFNAGDWTVLLASSAIGNVKTFQASTFYPAGAMIVNSGATYYATTNFTSDVAFNAADWTALPVTVPSSIPLSQKGAASGVAPLNASGKIDSTYLPAATAPSLTATFSVPGTLAAGAGTIAMPLPNCTINSVEAAVSNAPVTQPILVDVNRNGTTLFTTQASRPTIASNANGGYATSGPVVPTVTSFAAGALTIDVDQVGTSSGGEAVHVDTSAVSAVDGTTFTVNRPAAAQANDVLIVFAKITTTGLTWPGTPTGFTAIGSTIVDSGLRGYRWYKVLGDSTSDPGPYTFTASGTFSGFIGISATRRGVDTVNPIDTNGAVSWSTAATTFHTSDITTVATDTSELFMVILSGARSITTPGGYTKNLGFSGAGTQSRHEADVFYHSAGLKSGFDVGLSASTTGMSTRIALKNSAAPTARPGNDLVAVVSYTPS